MTGSTVRLRPPRHRVERRAVGWWTVRAVLGAAPVLAALAATYTVAGSTRPWSGAALVVAVVAAAGYAAVVPSWRYAVHRWETTTEAVYASSGWFVREWRVAPMSRIQTVDRVRGPLQQLFGLATVTVTTASAHGPVRLVGLDAEVAARTAEQLTELVRRTPGDAT
ncbi:PH domain-containing protein [Micromonospora echinaurantiaca]|uniref:PH domain-containing protein n=1 Tax=Micromonospora echinaurantiaca TaxID=47857 RepID=UPI00342F87B5